LAQKLVAVVTTDSLQRLQNEYDRLMKLSHTSTMQPEIDLVKIGPIDSEITCLEIGLGY